MVKPNQIRKFHHFYFIVIELTEDYGWDDQLHPFVKLKNLTTGGIVIRPLESTINMELISDC
jgi:hypothetical protein